MSDVYARNLSSRRGYPLWTPEPSIELPDSYRQGGLKIGDVGFVVPEDGSFDVFFNITLPPEHSLHAHDGVPDGFSQVKLSREDYRITLDAECPGRVISSPNVDCVVSRSLSPLNVNGEARSLVDHQFTLRHNEGAMLILPEGAERHRLTKELLLLDVVIQNAVTWYQFARERLYRNVGNDALYLVTGFHKACSWSLASFHNTGPSLVRCKLMQSTEGGPISPVHSTWEATHSLEWRIGPRHSESIGIPNQCVFITGFKIAVNEELLHLKRVTVKTDHSKHMLASRLVGFGAAVANLFLGGTSEDTQAREVTTQHDSEAGSKSTAERHLTDKRDRVTVERVPPILQPFHPSDIINHYLLKKEPSAEIAVTHDTQWISLMEKGVLRLEDMMHEGYLEGVVSREYRIITRHGAVYMEDIQPEGSSFTVNDSDVVNNMPKRTGGLQGASNHLGKLAEIDVIFAGQTGVGKSSLINMIMGAPDESHSAARVSNDARPCTTSVACYSVSLEDGLHYRLWDMPGLDEAASTRGPMAWIADKTRQLASWRTSELRTAIPSQIKLAAPIFLWCIDATKIDVEAHWHRFRKVYVDYYDRKALPAVVITRGNPKASNWHERCYDQLGKIDLGVDVPCVMVRGYITSSSECGEDSKALRGLIQELARRRVSAPH